MTHDETRELEVRVRTTAMAQAIEFVKNSGNHHSCQEVVEIANTISDFILKQQTK